MYTDISWVHMELFRRRRRRPARFIGIMSDAAQGALFVFILLFNICTSFLYYIHVCERLTRRIGII